MRVLENLEPKEVFSYFEDICSIPHGSGNTQQISDYCVNFAKEHGLKCRQEACGNVIIWKDATSGYEQAPTVILQGHMDMVAVKDADCTLDLEKDGLLLEIDGDWVQAKGTSLGADDGIAVAYALAILAADDIPHPALEAVFTVGEEVGLIGATALDASDLTGKILMNMDSENDGIFLIGCAGAATVACCLPVKKETVSGQMYDWHIDGLMGGHSGAEIDKNRANANSLLGKFLHGLDEKTDFELISVQGGQKDNAITREATAEILVLEENADAVREYAASVQGAWREEYAGTDEGITVTVEDEGKQEVRVLHPTSKEKVIFFLVNVPYGVQKMSGTIKGLVETSTNIGILKTSENEVMGSSSIRSSVETARDSLSDKIAYLTEFLGGEYERQGVYPAWEYRKDSPLRDKMVEVYEEMYGQKPNVVAIHAGLECGLFYKKMEGLDCVSLGPDMKDIHTSEEVLSISSTERVWKYLVKVLEALKE